MSEVGVFSNKDDKKHGGSREGSGRKIVSEFGKKRNVSVSFRVTTEEKEIIEKARGEKSLTEWILEKAKEKRGN